ncbi:hypothetical protein [Flavobacterium soyae]|uniref:hypothetical protein n=1 Tax=Flavobacterium soyae TaxID=2903098 RepID=UPI001E2E3C62|nr:hypothetical protein [Flavobacterium soyae]MCD9576259.1 hypothetical protein [Flavobacterium soyae]
MQLIKVSIYLFIILAFSKPEEKSIAVMHYNTAQEITGVYVLTSCENSRFKIKIEKKAGAYFFLIFDRDKIISKGKLKEQKNDDVIYLAFGKIGGVYNENKIQIQNYGNSMNEYEHFTQCDEKYLSFIKS